MKSKVKMLGTAATIISCALPALPVVAQELPGGGTAGNCTAGNFNAVPAGLQSSLFVPAGMVFSATLSTSISTQAARAGDLVQATLNQPINLGNSVIPAGSIITGQISEAKAGGFLGRSGMLGIKFNNLRTPNGADTPMDAHIVGGIGKYAQKGSQSGEFAGEDWKNKAGQTALRGALGAGTGAALGTAIGAIAGRGHGGAIGRGAWSGTAIGGGAGVADALLLRHGKEVNIASGQQMQLQLDAPMTVSTAAFGAL